MKLAFIDFLDSFSFNVVQGLKEAGHEVDVFTYPNHEQAWNYDFLVLGPGPGHPSEYQDVIPKLQERLRSKKKTFGVCLGHQLIWLSLGFNIVRSRLPLHGQTIKLTLKKEWSEFLKLPEVVEVQRYNSLVVEINARELPKGVVVGFSQDELQMSRSKSWLSYQFHPESVGTSFQKAFFSALTQF